MDKTVIASAAETRSVVSLVEKTDRTAPSGDGRRLNVVKPEPLPSGEAIEAESPEFLERLVVEEIVIDAICGVY